MRSAIRHSPFRRSKRSMYQTRRALRPPQETRLRQQRILGTHGIEDPGGSSNRGRRVIQSYETRFGRCPTPPTSLRSTDEASEQGHHPLEGGNGSSSNSSGEPRRESGGPIRRSRYGSSNSGDNSRDESPNVRWRRVDNKHRLRGRQGGALSYSSSPEPPEDWNSKWTGLDDKHLRYLEEEERGPRTERDQEQSRQTQERIVKYPGWNGNRMLARWLDRLPMHPQLNRVCGPNNELVQLSVVYNSLEGVAGKWYQD